MVDSPWQDRALLLLRVTFGGLMIALHGARKFENVLAGNMKFADPLGLGEATSLLLAAGAETVCGALVVLGCATRAALIPLIVTMLVAVFGVHAADPLKEKELGLLYLSAYGALFIVGPGRFAVSSLYLSKVGRRWPDVIRYLLC